MYVTELLPFLPDSCVRTWPHYEARRLIDVARFYCRMYICLGSVVHHMERRRICIEPASLVGKWYANYSKKTLPQIDHTPR